MLNLVMFSAMQRGGSISTLGFERSSLTLAPSDRIASGSRDSSAAAFETTIKSNYQITDLDLSGNQIGDAGGNALAGAMHMDRLLTDQHFLSLCCSHVCFVVVFCISFNCFNYLCFICYPYLRSVMLLARFPKSLGLELE
jgi:hypothetical protein